jgi:hypothetical protein
MDPCLSSYKPLILEARMDIESEACLVQCRAQNAHYKMQFWTHQAHQSGGSGCVTQDIQTIDNRFAALLL